MGANTHSANFERSSTQWAGRAFGDCTGINMVGDRTVEAWVKLDQNPSAGEYYHIAGFQGASGAWKNWVIYFWHTGGKPYLMVYLWDGSAQRQAWDMSAETLTTWRHIAWTLDISAAQATEHTLYMDTVDKGHGTISLANEVAATTAASAGYFHVAASHQGGGYELDGRIDDLRVWDDIRSEAEIQANYQKQLTGTEANLQGYWQFNNDAWIDKHSNGNDLTPYNTPTFVTDVPFIGSGDGALIALQAEEKMAKTQFVASEDMQIILPPFYDKVADAYITSADVATLVVEKPDNSLLSPAPTAVRNSNTDHWEASVSTTDYMQGQWLIKGTSDASDTLPQYLVLTWGDYVDEIRQATFGRWKIEGTQLKLYADDDATVLRTFDLKDSDGNPSSTRIFERDPA
jgi:hypothetical protein